MEVLSGPWADLALLLRQTIAQTDKETDGFLPLWLFGLLLFLSVCLLLLQLIIYLSWKLRQGDFCEETYIQPSPNQTDNSAAYNTSKVIIS
ncbi:hypothetical protein F2P81_023924 [Scophthalmus maximus]|uniref:Uncharacterized protein n=1 Tax=Scophthalmus maximus TaxID=52904 RepID=A0A6A4RXV7_SCOMX|nr:hypothetical protein F2P81_023924 [Scophthalmus maximus]